MTERARAYVVTVHSHYPNGYIKTEWTVTEALDARHAAFNAKNWAREIHHVASHTAARVVVRATGEVVDPALYT